MSIQTMLRRALTFNHLPKSVLPGGLLRRRPYASNAAAAAEEPNPDGNKVCGRRLSKKELHALVETFVNEYRAMNAGEFPRCKYTQKQVGGSYYRIRGILQEIQYAAKMSPSDSGVDHSLGREGTRGSESLTDVVGVSAQTVSEVEDDVDLGVVSDGSFEAKEESITSSSVEILSEEVITPGRGPGLDATQSNIGKVNAVEFSYVDPDIVDNDMEEQTNNQAVSIGPGREILQGGFEVISHSRDKSHDKTEEAQADLHNDVSKVNHLQIGDTNTTSLSSEYMEVVTKPDLEECKMKQHEEIPQADLLDSDKHVPPEADKVSKDLLGRPAADAEPQKTTLWGAMKSLADGIISIFRNQ